MHHHEGSRFRWRGATAVALAAFAVLSTASVRAQSNDFTQALNAKPQPGDISWINGIVNATHSEFYEGMSLPQRVLFDEILATSNGCHELEFNILAVKGGHHAFDFITSWDQAEDEADGVAPSVSPLGSGALMDVSSVQCGEAIGNTPDFEAICNNLHTLCNQAPATDPNCEDVDAPVPAAALGDSISDNIAAYEGFFGNRTVRIYSTKTIRTDGAFAPSLTFVNYTSDGADANYLLKWCDGVAAGTSDFLLEYAGHSAVGVNGGFPGVGYGAGLGAGDINGGPYHHSLDFIDDITIGSQDNQLMAAAIIIPCPTCEVDGPSPVCPESTNPYTVTVTGTATNPIYDWTVSGGCSIVGSSSGSSVSVLARSTCGSCELCANITSDNCSDGVECCKTIIVDDTTDPGATCPGPVSVQCRPDVPAPNPNLVTCTDNCPPGATPSFVGDSSDGQTCPEVITRTYKCTDACDNDGTCTQRITVNDTTNPVLVGCPGNIEECETDPVPPINKPTCTDNCGACTVTCTRSDDPTKGLNDPYPLGTTSISCVARDSCGRSSDECRFTVTRNPNPTVNPVGADACIDKPDPTISAGASGGTGALSCTWSGAAVGCLSSASVCNPTFDLSACGAGTHEVCVKAKDAKDCESPIRCTNVVVFRLPACSQSPFDCVIIQPQDLDTNTPGIMECSTIIPGEGGTTCTAEITGTGLGWELTGCSIVASKVRVGFRILDPSSAQETIEVTIKLLESNAGGDVDVCEGTCIGNALITVGCTVTPPDPVCEGGSRSLTATVDAGLDYCQTIEWFGKFAGLVDCSTQSLGTLLSRCPTSSPATCPTDVTAPLGLSDICTLSSSNVDTSQAGDFSWCAKDTEPNGFVSFCRGDLRVRPNPECSIEPQDPQLCEGDTVELCVVPTGGTAPYTYLWNTGATTSCITVSPSGGVNSYSARVRDFFNCESDPCETDVIVDNCACRVTGGGNNTSTPDDWPWDGTFGEGKSNNANSADDRYTFGGQAGAPTAEQPQPYGEWTHVNHTGPHGKFTFHAGTASAPIETEIDVIRCCDKDNCSPARPAPSKQIDFAGVGQFKNIIGNSPLKKVATEKVTFHWFEVNIDDLGEPGNRQDAPSCPTTGGAFCCPANGFNCGDDSGGDAKCACADFYRIKIYPAGTLTKPGPTVLPVYEVQGYINGGNFQIHPPIDH